MELYAQTICNLYQIKPSGLSFFELIILADSIHDQNYSMLGTQCFWYVSIICNIVEQEYTCPKIVTGPSSLSGGLVGNSIYLNDYLPDMSGTVKEFLVSRPDNKVASDLLHVKFKKHLAAKQEDVSFTIVYPEC